MIQLTGDQTAAMIKVAAKPPPERAAQSEFSLYFIAGAELISSHDLEEKAELRKLAKGQIVGYRSRYLNDEG